jgi:hypothetical protein
MTYSKAISYLILLELGSEVSATQYFKSKGGKFKMILN